MAFDLIKAFYDKAAEKRIDWIAKGFIFRDGTVYTINHDTKLLGRIFEILTEPILKEIADENGYLLETPEKQNFYPDFILTPVEKRSRKRIAVDVKTTYRDYNRKGEVKKFGFTLGSYASFLRNGTKNIQYSYEEYGQHFIIGFVYDRNENIVSSEAYSVEELEKVPSPYVNVEFFIQEKHKVAGFSTGSGNTENIGTIKASSIEPFAYGLGPFATMGNDVFEYYWRHYPRYKAGQKEYTNFNSFVDWIMQNDGAVPSEIAAAVLDYAESDSSDEYEVDEIDASFSD